MRLIGFPGRNGIYLSRVEILSHIDNSEDLFRALQEHLLPERSVHLGTSGILEFQQEPQLRSERRKRQKRKAFLRRSLCAQTTRFKKNEKHRENPSPGKKFQGKGRTMKMIKTSK